MSEHILHCTTLGQRALRKKMGKKYIFVVLFLIVDDDENSAVLFPAKYQFAILFCGV